MESKYKYFIRNSYGFFEEIGFLKSLKYSYSYSYKDMFYYITIIYHIHFVMVVTLLNKGTLFARKNWTKKKIDKKSIFFLLEKK